MEVHIDLTQKSFQQMQFPRRRFWWDIVITLYQWMPQLWYQKILLLLVNMLVLILWHNGYHSKSMTCWKHP